MPENQRQVDLTLQPGEADALHAAIEDLLESGKGNPELERAYRLLGWRILADRSGEQGGTGLIGSMAVIARNADSLEEYEVARDRELGPIIGGLESGENRDP